MGRPLLATVSNPGTIRCRKRRQETRDDSLPAHGLEKSRRIDLGLALLARHAIPGVSYSCEEIAAWAGCTGCAIHRIERVALRKLANRARFSRDPLLAELLGEVLSRRQP